MPRTEVGKVMGTFLSITTFEEKGEAAIVPIYRAFWDIEQAVSRFLPDSDLSKICQVAGEKSVSVSPLCLSILKTSVKQAKFTEGIFDPTVGALTALWNVGQNNEKVPQKEEIRRAESFIDYRRILIDGDTVFLKEKGMSLDLGGMAKEYALHKAAEIAEDLDVPALLIDAGGDMCLVGNKPDGSAWRMGVQHPRRKETLAAAISMTEWDTIETSGDYRRFLAKDDVFQSHIFQLHKDSEPLISATLIYKRGKDMLPITGAACVAGGLARTAKWLEMLPEVEGIFITADRKVYVTEGISFVTKILTKDLQRKALILNR